jgi:L-2,4-diaminobutyrate decarboxylase
MLEKIGWFKADHLHESADRKIMGGGVLTHGGSLANLTALLSARAHAIPDAWKKGIQKDLYVLVPESSHYSLSRSASIMGLGSDKVIPIEVDIREQIIPDKLRKLLHKMTAENKKVMAVVANACATGSGLYDPIDEMGDICQEYSTWFHIDGAHGAGALLTDKYRQLMKGVNKADSMIWDAHKMLRTSALSAAVLYKDHRNLDKTFHQKGSYIIFEKEQLGYDFMNNTIECTKAALGTKLFWALAAEGEKGIAKYIEKQYERTRIFHRFINAQDDFDCPYIPQSNILCFRYTGLDSSDEFQLKLRNDLVKEGNFYITSTLFNGKRHLRLTVMNPDTELMHIEKLLDSLREIGAGISQRRIGV